MKILAFDIGGTAIKYGIVDEEFNITDVNEIPSEADKGGKGIIEKLTNIFESYKDIDRVGISTAGQVNPHSAFVIHSLENFPGYSGTDFKKIFTERQENGFLAVKSLNNALVRTCILFTF